MPPGRDQVKAMERLARILATLEDAGVVGATTERLLEVAQYGGQAAPQDQLGVDLKNLRKQGWQIDRISPVGEPGRYRMVSGDNRLRVKLSPDQLAALHRAVILTRRADLAKRLGVAGDSLPSNVGTDVVPHEQSTELTRALQAVQTRSRMRFDYKGTPRLVHPSAVRFQNYRWYLSGPEEGTDTVKHFIVAELKNVALDPPGTAEPLPVGRRIPLHPLRWTVDPPTPVTVRTVPEYVPDVVRWLLEPDERVAYDGVVDLRYTVTHRQAFRARIYGLGARVTLADGGDVRSELVAELREMVGL